jgi:hypothetical protein
MAERSERSIKDSSTRLLMELWDLRGQIRGSISQRRTIRTELAVVLLHTRSTRSGTVFCCFAASFCCSSDALLSPLLVPPSFYLSYTSFHFPTLASTSTPPRLSRRLLCPVAANFTALLLPDVDQVTSQTATGNPRGNRGTPSLSPGTAFPRSKPSQEATQRSVPVQFTGCTSHIAAVRICHL